MDVKRAASVQPLDTIISELNHLHDSQNLSWRKIAARSEFRGIPAGTLCSIAKGREPKKRKHRMILKLPPLAIAVDPCPHCGDTAHTYDCQEQIVKPKPAPRPKRKRRPYKNIDPTNPAQVQRQIAKYMPGWELVRKDGK